MSKVNLVGVRRSHSHGGGGDFGVMGGMTTSAAGLGSGVTSTASGRTSRAGVVDGGINGEEGSERGREQQQEVIAPPNMVQLLPKGTLAKKEREKDKEREKERSKTRSGERESEQEMEERRRRAMARNKSWADDYHCRGW